jgi:hypothetical protein
MDVNIDTGQTRKTHRKNKSINVRKRVAESLVMLYNVIDKTPGLILENDESNEGLLTYVELQRGGREKAVV